MYLLDGIVQHYTWGGYEFLPELLGEKNLAQQAFAEYWLGAHPKDSSIVRQSNEKLIDFIAADSSTILGKDVATKFGALPYLLKILDVRQMLSIQVHPTIEGAMEGFKEEEQRNIDVLAPERNYRDKNHKPELMVALSDFWLLHGFKDPVNMGMIFETTPELQPLKSLFEEGGYRSLYEEVMTMQDRKVNDILGPLMERIIPLYDQGELEKDEEDFWAARAAKSFCSDGNYDRGIFSIYFFNLVYLRKGEGVFQPPGLPHAYLEGRNIEVMANSDNVLRAGLTSKHIDVPELMKHVLFEATIPNIITTGATTEKIYRTAAEEFELHLVELGQGKEISESTTTGEIFLLLEGKALFTDEHQEIELQKGGALFVIAGTRLGISSLEELSLVRVTVPKHSKNKEE